MAWAANSGAPSEYIVHVEKIQLKNAVSNTWVTIGTPNVDVNIADVSPGAVAASFSSGISIPAGTYNNFKIIISKTFTIKGYINDGGTDYYTKAGGSLTMNGTVASDGSTATWPGGALPSGTVQLNETGDTVTTTAPAGEATYTLDLNGSTSDIEMYLKTDLATPITITASSTISMWFSFDTQGTLQHFSFGSCATDVGADGCISFTPPATGTKFGITVDGTTTTLNGSDMRIDF